jgi:hypothetical protein
VLLFRRSQFATEKYAENGVSCNGNNLTTTFSNLL